LSHVGVHNIKKKLLTCNANIYFNRQCIARNLIPKYVERKIPNTSPAARRTKRKTQTQRIRDEMKFLYAKKQNVNYQLYQLHLQISSSWGHITGHIFKTIDDVLNDELKLKYNPLNKKLNNLQKNNLHHNLKHNNTFYPRIINNTKIEFTDEQTSLLNKGLKYDLRYKPKNWMNELALEAETAIHSVPPKDQEAICYQVARNIKSLYKHQTNISIELHTMKEKYPNK
jgi:hypothetical protein